MNRMQSPKILIDARMVGSHGHGIATYVTALALGLDKKRAQIPYTPIFLTLKGASLPNPFKSFQKIETETEFLNPTEIFSIPIILKRENISLYHSTSFSSLLYYPCNHIITPHDLNHIHYGTWKEKIYYNTLFKLAAHSAKKIITVSKTSQKEIANWLNVPLEKISVAYNAIEKNQLTTNHESILKKYNLTSKKYFLAVSNTKKHKNISFLIHAHKKYCESTANVWPLVLSMEGENLNNIVYAGNISREELYVLRSHCSAHFFPSLYEGFGLPPLEAALCGCPTVASDISAHQEALSPVKEKILLDPQNTDLWSQAFHQAQNQELEIPSKESIEKILTTYSTENLANRMDQMYRECLSL